jgi:hypothetical protein
MLHVNCDMKMRWETDMLQMRVAAPTLSSWSTPSTATKSFVQSNPENKEDNETGASKTSPNSREWGHLISLGEEDEDNALTEHSQASLEALTRDEEWDDDDLGLLRMAIRGAPSTSGGGGNSARKSYVGNFLRTTNPARFPHRDADKDFLAMATDGATFLLIAECRRRYLVTPCKIVGRETHIYRIRTHISFLSTMLS